MPSDVGRLFWPLSCLIVALGCFMGAQQWPTMEAPLLIFAAVWFFMAIAVVVWEDTH